MAAVPPGDPDAPPTGAEVRALVELKPALDRAVADVRRRFWIRVAGIITGLAVILTFALLISNNSDLIRQNRALIARVAADERHSHAAITCLDQYDKAVALNHRRQDEATRRFRTATRQIIIRAGRAHSHAEFVADVAAFNRAYRAENRIPTVAPPPPACR